MTLLRKKEVTENINGQDVTATIQHIKEPTKSIHDKKAEWNDTADKWLITLKGESFDYYTGAGHRELVTSKNQDELTERTTTHFYYEGKRVQREKAKYPTIKDVLYSLVMDSDALNYQFHEWCDNFGYGHDSIKAKETYDACIQNAIKLRSLGFDIEALQEFYQDY